MQQGSSNNSKSKSRRSSGKSKTSPEDKSQQRQPAQALASQSQPKTNHLAHSQNPSLSSSSLGKGLLSDRTPSPSPPTKTLLLHSIAERSSSLDAPTNETPSSFRRNEVSSLSQTPRLSPPVPPYRKADLSSLSNGQSKSQPSSRAPSRIPNLASHTSHDLPHHVSALSASIQSRLDSNPRPVQTQSQGENVNISIMEFSNDIGSDTTPVSPPSDTAFSPPLATSHAIEIPHAQNSSLVSSPSSLTAPSASNIPLSSSAPTHTTSFLNQLIAPTQFDSDDSGEDTVDRPPVSHKRNGSLPLSSHHQITRPHSMSSHSNGDGTLFKSKSGESSRRHSLLRSESAGSSSSTGSDLDPSDYVLMTNASETGYEGYEKMAEHESLDYHTIHNELLRSEIADLRASNYISDNMQRWGVTTLVGVLIGSLDFSFISQLKQSLRTNLHWQANVSSALIAKRCKICLGLLLMSLFFCSSRPFDQPSVGLCDILRNQSRPRNDRFSLDHFLRCQNINATSKLQTNFLRVSLTRILFRLVVIQPAAGGSGIPEVKGFLNGSSIKRAMNVKTFIVKLFAVITAVASSLPVGPEGPMIHLGAMIGGGVSQPRSKTLGMRLWFMQKFHTDKDRRDFIAMGAACGVASAFGAPLGGVLFAIEEASSFWSQMLTWRTFFACMLSTFVSNFLLQGIMRQQWSMYNSASLIYFNVGASDDAGFYMWELIPFALMGMLSGLTGAAFNWMSERIAIFRQRHIERYKHFRLLEVFILMVVVSVIVFFLPFFFGCKACDVVPNITSCHVNGDDDQQNQVVPFTCAAGSYNDMATLFFTSQSGGVRHLFSRKTEHEFSIEALLLFWVLYMLLAMYSSGSAVAGGLLVPLLLIGAAYGRLIGNVLLSLGFTIDPGVYALIGAASFFSGVCRMTVSLSIIMLEITNDLQYLPPIMLTVMCAKWVGDMVTPPLYEALMEIKHFPFLDQEPPIEMDVLVSSDIMATHVKVMTESPRVSDVIELLKSCEHQGFPVVSTRSIHHPNVPRNRNSFSRKSLPVPSAFHLGGNSPSHSPPKGTPHLSHSLSHPIPLSQSHPAPNGHSSSSSTPIHIGALSQPQSAIYLNNAAQNRPLTAGYGEYLGNGSGRVLRGLILRKQLLVLLSGKIWRPTCYRYTPAEFRHLIATVDVKRAQQLIMEIEKDLTIGDKEARMDIRPYMNRSPFSVHYDFHSVFVFRLFRSMGLRHLPVVNDSNEVIGIITRKDIVHPIIKMKYQALLAAKDSLHLNNLMELSGSGNTQPPTSSSDDDQLDGRFPSRRSTYRAMVARGKRLPHLRSYSYLSPSGTSPSTPPSFSPTLIRSQHDSPNSASGHFNWASRLSTRV